MKSQSKIPTECSEAGQCGSKVCPDSHSSVPNFTFGMGVLSASILTRLLKKMEMISFSTNIEQYSLELPVTQWK